MFLYYHTIAERVRDNIKFKEDKETKDWLEEYNKLKYTEKTDLMVYMEKSQAVYIRDSMRKLVNPIHLLGLGSFYYKKARKDYYDIKEANPELSNDEVAELVKQKYWDRVQKSKSIRSKTKTVKTGKKHKKSKALILSIKK